jgi:hypothetical protein
MKYGKPLQTFFLAGLFATGLSAQVRERDRLRAFPPDIVPPEVFQSRDALQVDPQHYRLEFENDKIRVLRLTLKTNEAVPMHDDVDALVVCLKECHVRFTLPNGRSEDVHMETGTTRWTFGDRRSEKNLGTKPVDMLFFETKNPNTR